MKPDMSESDVMKETLQSEDISFSVLSILVLRTHKADQTRVHRSTITHEVH